jgi:hypothetical protein
MDLGSERKIMKVQQRAAESGSNYKGNELMAR